MQGHLNIRLRSALISLTAILFMICLLLALTIGGQAYAADIWAISPSGTINTSSATISAYFGDDAVGLDLGSINVTLDGVALTGCTVNGWSWDYYLGYTRANVVCQQDGLTPGSHTIVATAADWDNHVATQTGTFVVDLGTPCVAAKPNLSLAAPDTGWASYADYTAKKLSVTWTVNNNGSSEASNVSLLSSQSTYSQITTITAMPAGLGNISAGGSVSVTVQYQLPAGFTGSGFRVVNTASAQDCAGAGYTYP